MHEETYVERNWTDSETKALLYIRASEKFSQQISGTVRDSLIYEEIARLLRAQGIQRTQRQVTSKLKTLKQKFLKIHQHHRTSARVYWSYYDLCSSIWGTRRPADALRLGADVKLEEPQSTSVEDSRSTDVEISISNDEETDVTPKVTQPLKKKAKKDHITESIRDQEGLYVQDEREYEESLRREVREDQREERANLMVMWKEMMEFQGNLLKEFIHHSSLPVSVPYHKHTHYKQSSSDFPSTSYTAPYGSPGLEIENESTILQEEEEKYENIPSIMKVPSVNCVNDSQSNVTLALSPPPPHSAEETELQLSVLRRQETVLRLQEEYYTLKIKFLKNKMSRDPQHSDKES